MTNAHFIFAIMIIAIMIFAIMIFAIMVFAIMIIAYKYLLKCLTSLLAAAVSSSPNIQ